MDEMRNNDSARGQRRRGLNDGECGHEEIPAFIEQPSNCAGADRNIGRGAERALKVPSRKGVERPFLEKSGDLLIRVKRRRACDQVAARRISSEEDQRRLW